MWEKNSIKEVLYSEEDIRKRAGELGRQITEDYKNSGKPLLLVALLRGSVPFLGELIRCIDMDIQYDFMDVSSYAGTKSTGDIRIIKDLDTSVKGLDILLVEDIVDTGRTIAEVVKTLKHKGAESVRIVTLLDKPSRRTTDIYADYIGFTVPDAFVVGFGMDYDQKFRCLPYIGVLKDEVYSNEE